MRMALRVALALCFLAACQSPVASPPVTTSPVGLSGDVLTTSLAVVVLDESTGEELAGATVTCGDASLTTSVGAALRCDAAAVAGSGVVVSAPGRVTERWIGIGRAHAVIALATRTQGERIVTGAITGASDHVSVGLTSPFGILRSGAVTRGAMGCADASDCRVAVGASFVGAHDAAILDHGGERLVLARDVEIGADGSFAVDLLAQTEIEPLITLSVTLPGAAGLTEVVGVPGLATENGVALLGSLADGTSTLAPAREAALASERLWFVARARTADGAGESFALDRDIPVGEAEVLLPAAFLAVPDASREGGSLTFSPAADASLYVIESSDATGVVERALVFGPVSSTIVPVVGTRVTVRAIDAQVAGAVDLDAIAASTTRFSERAL